MIYICNGFSNSMCVDPRIKRIDEPLSEEEFTEIIKDCEWESAIGYDSLANCLSQITGEKIIKNRLNLKVTYDDVLLIVSLQKSLPSHTTPDEYKKNLSYSFVRFEKQTMLDIINSLKKIENIKMEAL